MALVFALILSCSRRAPTYEQDVRPLLARSCAGCHSPGGTASTLPLLSYEDALRSAGHMRVAVQSRMMPPWGADNSGLCNKWRGARWLSDQDVATLVAWSDGAHPRGDPQPAEAIPEPVEHFRSEATLEMDAPYTPQIGNGFRCFVADPKLGRDRLLTAIRVRSTEPRSVAQIALHALDTAEQERAAERLDADDSEPGYACYGSSRVSGARLVASWTWDGPVLRLPQGTGLRLRARRKLVLQIHYNLIATGPAPTRTAVDLEFSDGAVEEAEIVPLQASAFELPPDRTYARVAASATFDRRARLLAVAPRMHTFAKTMQLDLDRERGSSCLANFDHWSFFRQRLFEYEAPQRLLPGDVLRLSCVYTTLGKARPVRSGEWIEDEECAAFLYVAIDSAPPSK
jgi:hypothetical protein